MGPKELKLERNKRGWTQQEASHRLGMSQPYLAMLENGGRRLTPTLGRRFMRVYRLAPTVLPPPEEFRLQRVDAQSLTEQVAALGYPGFAYLRSRVRKRNPSEFLLTALGQENLEARLVEALPWLLLRYWDLDSKWLVEQAKLHDLQNRLGFIARLAREVSEKTSPPNEERTQTLRELELALEQSKLARMDTLCQKTLTSRERQWLTEQMTEEARDWNLLTPWRSGQLRYVS